MTFFQLSTNCLSKFSQLSPTVYRHFKLNVSEWHNKCNPTVLVNMSTNVILTLDQRFSQLTTNTSALEFKLSFVLTLISISFTLYQHVPSCNLLGWVLMIHNCYLLMNIVIQANTGTRKAWKADNKCEHDDITTWASLLWGCR